ncbi:hypothetical protein MTP03_17840 [Tsukamurella sp. PLM1]|nr:hypothetical protein MTP03_17840 [Tsukamurella sp. PLM1]
MQDVWAEKELSRVDPETGAVIWQSDWSAPSLSLFASADTAYVVSTYPGRTSVVGLDVRTGRGRTPPQWISGARSRSSDSIRGASPSWESDAWRTTA